MYIEGTRSRSGRLEGEPKPGVGRLALETGAQVVPTALPGTAKVRNWKKLQFPKVTVQYGDPIRFERLAEPTREQAKATANEIFDAIKVLYHGLEAHGRRGAVKQVRQERRLARAGKKRTAAA